VDDSHGRIIATAAKAALTPLGFRRKGRSRVWRADRGFWLSVVEFQPSGFCKGSYLNVSVHWLWGPQDFVSMDYIDAERRTFIEFGDDEQFKPLAEQQAASAAEASAAFRARFSTIEDTAVALASDAQTFTRLSGRDGGWPDVHAGIALGLTGDRSAARGFLRAAIKGFDSAPDLSEPLARFEALLDEPVRFRAAVEARINRKRESLGLGGLETVF
jgi:hypothetical protein